VGQGVLTRRGGDPWHLQGPHRRRALLRTPQAVARPGHPLRQARHRLPRGRPPRRRPHLAAT